MLGRFIKIVMVVFLTMTITFQMSALQDDGMVLTLERAVELALKNNESLLSTQVEIDRARALVKEAFSEALPKVDFNSTYTRNWALPVFTFGGQKFKAGTDNVINLGVGLSQTIYRGGRVGAGLKIARYFQEISKKNTDHIRAAVVLTVHKSYYEVLRAEAILEVAQAAYRRAVAQHEGVTQFYEAGTVSNYDLLRSKVEVTNAHPAVTQARNHLAISSANLKRFIGLPQTVKIRYIGDLEVQEPAMPTDIASAIRKALANRSDLKAAKLKTVMDEAAIRLAHSKNGPDISLSAGYQMQAQVNDSRFKSLALGDFSRSWNTLLNVSYPVFDGRQNSGQIMQAQADFEKSRYSESQLKKQIEVDVTIAMLNITEATERVDAGAEAVELASRGLAIVKLQYEGGISTQLELIDAQLTLKRAQTDQVTAKYDYITAVAVLQNVLGGSHAQDKD